MNKVIELGFIQMLSAYIFILVLLLIVRRRGIKREKEIIISCIRMTIQLILVGYILGYVFDNSNPFVTVIIMLIMEIFAIYNIFKRVKVKLSSNLKKAVAISMSIGTIVSLCYFLFVVVRLTPWYDPRYFIPIGGMIIGNAMTGISLGVDRLINGINTQKHLVEGALMLGAEPKEAVKDIVNNAFDASIMPTINSMVGMGIVFLPGMMTGQILSGTAPTTAIGYQIAIMLGILGSVSLTVIIFVQLGYKSFFNEKSQLVISD